MQRAPEEERRVITALFTDIVGSTASAEHLDPEDVRARLSPYYARLRAELEAFGGSVEKFIGDAVVALFGAPQAHEDDPERAVRAAFAIGDAIAELNEADAWLDLRVRTGVCTGEALVVLDADPAAGEGMAAGDVMNTAARVQSAAPVNGVVVNEATMRATAHAIEYREAPPVAAKGKSEPVPVWEAVRVRETPGRRRGSDTPLVGREAEIRALVETWEGVHTNGRRAAVTVVAPPGVGKSRLLGEFRSTLDADVAIRTGHCLPYGEGITYWPVIEIIKDAAGIMQTDDADVTSSKLGALVEGLRTDRPDDVRTIAAALANLVGAPLTPQGTYSAAQITQPELHWGIRRLFELLAEQAPLVLVFEDLHWAEDTLLELFRFVADGGEPSPLLVLASTRPDIGDRRPALLAEAENRRVIELAPLTAADSAELVERLAAAAALPAGTLETLIRNAGGNPLFLEETVRMLAEWEGSAGDEALPVPTSLQGLLGSRLDQLPAPERRLAQHASVIGTVFWPGALAVLGDDYGDLDRSLRDLEARDIVREQDGTTIAGEREYAFKHVLIRDVAYSRLPKGRRAELHVRFGDWVVELPGTEDEFVEIVAYHLEQACRFAGEVARSPVDAPVERAVESLARAGEKSERREGFREAGRFYERGLAVADGRPELAVGLRLRRGKIRAALGDLAEAHDELDEVAREAADAGRLELRCAALVALANVDTKQGRAADSRRNLTEAVAIAAEIGDRFLQVRALYEFAYFGAWFEGAVDAAIAQLRDALAIAEEIGDRALRIEGHMRLGTLLFNTGDLAGAEDAYARCSALAAELGSLRDEARSVTLLGLVRYYRGDLREAERLAEQALGWLEKTSDTYLQIQNLRELARYALVRNDVGAAEERLREAMPLALDVGGWLVIEIYRYLVEALVRQGRVEEARELVDFAGRNLPPEDPYAQAALALAQAAIATAEGERGGAVDRFDEALRLLREQRQLTDLGEARIAFSRALRRFGDSAEARAELERAREEFARMDAQALVAQIDRELVETVTGADAVGPRSDF